VEFARDYRRRIEHREAIVYWSAALMMIKRLTRCENRPGAPPSAWRRPQASRSGYVNLDRKALYTGLTSHDGASRESAHAWRPCGPSYATESSSTQNLYRYGTINLY
jgi:hypothetical protein